MKIKICGMKEPGNIRQVAALQPDYMGFIFYPLSKRYVGEDMNEGILDEILPGIKKTGVFVNADFNEISGTVKKYKLDAVQLHGDESAEFCRVLKNRGIEVIKAVGIDENFDFTVLEKYTEATDHFLFDTKTPAYGGSGKSFDWKLLKQYPYRTSYFLSGGLSSDNLSEIKLIEDERLYAVDLNSQFESDYGIKDIEKVKGAISYMRLKEK